MVSIALIQIARGTVRMVIRTPQSIFEFYSLRRFYFRSKWLGEAFANVESVPEKRELTAFWDAEDLTVFKIYIGHWRLTYDVPQWAFKKRHAIKTEQLQHNEKLQSDL